MPLKKYEMKGQRRIEAQLIKIGKMWSQAIQYPTPENIEAYQEMIEHYSGYVYVCQIEGQALYKIGFSKSPETRLISLNYDYEYLCAPFDSKLILAHSFPTNMCYRAEHELHHEYRKCHITRELFGLSYQQMADIRSIQSRYYNLDLIGL